MGAFSRLQSLLRQVDHIQFIEPPAFDPDITIRARTSHCHQIQIHCRRQSKALLMVGVVPAQLCPARSRIQVDLPFRPEVPLKLGQRLTVPPALPDQRCFLRAVQLPERTIPLPCLDLLS